MLFIYLPNHFCLKWTLNQY